MIDHDHPKARYHPGWTILGTLAGTFVVLAVLMGQAAQINQLKDLNVYLRSENDAARTRQESLAKQLNDAVVKLEPTLQRNAATLEQIAQQQAKLVRPVLAPVQP